jgi:hypothetical protein
MIPREHAGGTERRMDHANDNEPAQVAQSHGNYPLLALALLLSCALWFVLGLSVWRALSGWLHSL